MKNFNIEAIDMGNNQADIAEWVEHYIFEQQTKGINIDEMLEDPDQFVSMACKALGWHSQPSVGGLVVESVWNV
jgi:hypothetical protein